MPDPDFDKLHRAFAFIAGELYKAGPVHLDTIEKELERLLRLIAAYRKVEGPSKPTGAGAAHLAQTPGKE